MKRMITSLIFMVGTLYALPATAQSITMTITNLTQGSYFTPLLVSAHTS